MVAASVSDLLEHGPEERRRALAARIESVLSTVGACPDGSEPGALLNALDAHLRQAPRSEGWLACAVITGHLPGAAEVHELYRAGRLGQGLAYLFHLLSAYGQLGAPLWHNVEILTDTVVVDLHHTARNLFATGIQRVAREAARRWRRDHQLVLVGWTEGYTAYRRLSDPECEAALNGSSSSPGAHSRRSTSSSTMQQDVVVPWRCVHIVPELPAEPVRAHRYQGFVAFSESTTGLIGYDCVPLVAANTCAEGMAHGFATFLAAAAHLDRIATISRASALEYEGWRTMLAGIGQDGPDIQVIPLGVSVETSSNDEIEEIRKLMCIDSRPVVLAVGSHEPRKNQLSVLHAAEELWREGLVFTLTFIGGNAWNSDQFAAMVEELQRVNRPVQVIVGLSDDLLWAAYRVAYCTVFPSLHEGYGLPVVESLASGTPVITSNFGSMAENAAAGGALLIDPRDDQHLTGALRALLLDHPLRDRLAAETANLRFRTWEQYASETWDYLVHGQLPPAPVG
jgi:glycosyltransferase involved in cell wall biosynthesis